MTDLLTSTAPSVRADVQERRRPGRIENASPALIELMRPTSASARVRVALYDAPGFSLPSADAMRPVRAPGFALRVLVAVIASGVAWGLAFKAMCMVWG